LAFNVFLTPDLRPFFGGNLLPTESRYGRVSFLQVLQQVDSAWKTRRAELENSAQGIHSQLEAATRHNCSNVLLTADTLRAAGSLFKQSYDPRHGGFGGEPKFPNPVSPHSYCVTPGVSLTRTRPAWSLFTCDRMAAGGIHDQLGGGFSRYSVDAEWLVPHFEKMLYDNAQLASYMWMLTSSAAMSVMPPLPAIY